MKTATAQTEFIGTAADPISQVRKLWRAVLMRAAQDLVLGVDYLDAELPGGHGKVKAKREIKAMAADALNWLSSDSTKPLSCLWACEVTGISIRNRSRESLIKEAKKLREFGRMLK